MNELLLPLACYTSAAITIAVLWWIAPELLTLFIGVTFALALATEI